MKEKNQKGNNHGVDPSQLFMDTFIRIGSEGLQDKAAYDAYTQNRQTLLDSLPSEQAENLRWTMNLTRLSTMSRFLKPLHEMAIWRGETLDEELAERAEKRAIADADSHAEHAGGLHGLIGLYQSLEPSAFLYQTHEKIRGYGFAPDVGSFANTCSKALLPGRPNYGASEASSCLDQTGVDRFVNWEWNEPATFQEYQAGFWHPTTCLDCGPEVILAARVKAMMADQALGEDVAAGIVRDTILERRELESYMRNEMV